MIRHRRSAILCAALIAAFGAAAGAQTPPVQTGLAEAQKAYGDGAAAYRLGKFEEAARKFEAAYRITRYPNMLFDIAQAYRRAHDASNDIDHLRHAIELYRSY